MERSDESCGVRITKANTQTHRQRGSKRAGKWACKWVNRQAINSHCGDGKKSWKSRIGSEKVFGLAIPLAGEMGKDWVFQ